MREPSAPPSQVTCTFTLHAALFGLVCVLALLRILTGPWYHTYNPPGANLLEGWPVSWESEYYLIHLPSFLGDGPPALGLSLVHTRTFINLYLASMLTAWTGSAFWSFAAVDVVIWFLGGVAAFHLMRRLGTSSVAAALGTLLCVSSPILSSNMWRHDLHAANFSTMPLGLWAGIALVEDERNRGKLTLGLGALLFLLSVSYQYQWILVPVLAVLLAFQTRFAPTSRAGIWAGAVVLYLVASAIFRGILDISGYGSMLLGGEVVSRPSQLALDRLRAARGPLDLVPLLPVVHVSLETMQVYHPLVFITGIAGMLLANWRTRLVALVASAVTLASTLLYSAPWTAMSAFPLVYLGAGMACEALGLAAAHVSRLLPIPYVRVSPFRLGAVVTVCVSVLCAAMLCVLTNLDLAGDTRFLMRFWSYFGGGPLF